MKTWFNSYFTKSFKSLQKFKSCEKFLKGHWSTCFVFSLALLSFASSLFPLYSEKTHRNPNRRGKREILVLRLHKIFDNEFFLISIKKASYIYLSLRQIYTTHFFYRYFKECFILYNQYFFYEDCFQKLYCRLFEIVYYRMDS